MKSFRILVLGMIFLAAAMTFVSAQDEQIGCCIKTTDNPQRYCIDDMTKNTALSNCTAGEFRSGKVCSDQPECRLGTCKPDSGTCQENKMQAECGAGWVDAPIDDVPECQSGCCSVAGKNCEVKEQKVCYEWAEDHDYTDSDVVFDANIKKDSVCKQEVCGKEDQGCCVLDAGKCSYTSRQDCTFKGGSIFHQDIMCSKVNDVCQIKTHDHLGCGTLEPNTNDICWFDSQGNQEECLPANSCSYPAGRCVEQCLNANCTDKIRNMVVGIGEPYCNERKCYFTLKTSQKIDGNKIVTQEGGAKTLLAGQSMCYNFFSAQGEDWLQKISNGLTNSELHCQEANAPEPSIINGDTQRAQICKDNSAGIHATRITNNWDKCRTCGQSGSAVDIVGDMFGVGFSSGANFNSILGDYCTESECESLGDCVYHQDIGRSMNSVPIGSCDPIYPPGVDSTCGQCGEGNDQFWQLCTKSECYSLGNCNFEEWNNDRRLISTLASYVGISYMQRIDLVPLDSLVTALFYKTNVDATKVSGCLPITILYPVCVPVQFTKNAIIRYNDYAVKGVSYIVKKAWSPVSWLLGKLSGSGGGAVEASKGVAKEAAQAAQAQIAAETRVSELTKLQSEKAYAKSKTVATDLANAKKDLETANTQVADAKKLEDSKVKNLKDVWKKIGDWWTDDPIDVVAWGMSVIRGLTATNEIMGKDPGFCTSEGISSTDLCESCNADPYRICTVERCARLGNNCHPVADTESRKQGNYICYKEPCDDLNPPKITKISTNWFVDHTTEAEVTGNSVNSDHMSVTVPWDVSNFQINITTDVRAECRWADTRQAEFGDMNAFDTYKFSDSKSYVANIPFCSGTGAARKCYAPGRESTIYIKCANLCGANNSKEDDNNYIKFKVGATPDFVPPDIDLADPENNQWVPENWKETEVELWLTENGPAQGATCKFSDITMDWTQNWSQMIPFEGRTQGAKYPVNSSIVSGYCMNNQPCITYNASTCARCKLKLDLTKGFQEFDWNEMLKNATQEERDRVLSAKGSSIFETKTKMFSYVFICEDKDHNQMDTYGYKIMMAPPYNVTIAAPKAFEKTYDKTIEIVVNTTQSTECRYSVDENIKWDLMTEIDNGDWGDTHTGIINKTMTALPPPTGSKHELYVSCRGFGGLPVNKQSTFYLLKDVQAPEVIRAYNSNDILNLVTNEESECKYRFDDRGCSFNFETEGESLLIPSVDSIHHLENWVKDRTYYIKCKDQDNNYPGGSPSANKCTQIIRAYEVPRL